MFGDALTTDTLGTFNPPATARRRLTSGSADACCSAFEGGMMSIEGWRGSGLGLPRLIGEQSAGDRRRFGGSCSRRRWISGDSVETE